MEESELVSISPKSLIYYVSSGVVVEKHTIFFFKKENFCIKWSFWCLTEP